MAIKPIQFDSSVFDISYDIIGKGDDLLILHGWGANKELMKSAFEPHLSHFRRLYVDLPGFGKSSNDMVLDTQQYSLIVKKFIDSLDFNPKAIISHSFGGKVATLLNPPKLVLMGSPGIPQKKSLKTKTKIYLSKLLKHIVGSSISRFFVSDDIKGYPKNMYETFKQVVDEDFRDSYKSYKNEALLLWGRSDSASPLKSAYCIDEIMDNSTLIVYEGDHFFFLDKGGIICQKIVEFLGE